MRAIMGGRAAERGLTLFEAMVITGIVGTFGVLGLSYGCRALQSGASYKADAEEQARAYARDMNLKVDGISCGDTPNQKGMVYCSLRSGTNTIPLVCIGKYKVGNGCRPTTVVAPGAEPAAQ